MKVLITGGAGFIGGNFVSYMIKKYPAYEIYNLDALTYAGDLAKHEDILNHKNYHFIKGNIVNRSAIYSLFQQGKFDCVIHFAAESHVDRSIEDPEVFTRTNVSGTQVLLDAAKDIGVKKFVHISTDEVYGELELNSDNLFTETTPLQPNSPYSASKASSDLLVNSYYRTYDLPVNITRCSNNYGPYQHAEKLIPLTISKVLNKQEIPVYGDGKNVRDWLHVYDHCTAIDLVLHEGVNGEVYNIGGNNEKSNIAIVSSIIEILDGSLDLIEYVTDRLGHDRRYAIDSSKISKLGWRPMYNFNIGLKKTIDWYVKNQNTFKEKVNKNGNV
ncbi:dTDP-glucose 4,6-dehydratase [Gracilibacillus salitolerans]|uniref:dTDP-glucose 4,6-dehydratase n=1 Tax=Gracilibacillus salitolerans TaxID=2663022 RepID=A0A5Q2TGU6_9BACI|nr:dTDP-glucose 4,6-dehydratase [Gracilibacillus salitolerans]QGH34059.1 dTDP-glucose 4,6-dehydratase [Gracilibacillus salitolerans]